MTKNSNSQENIPFALSSSMKITFTLEQLVEIALNSLTEHGHTVDPDTVHSVLTKAGLTMTAETIVGDAPPKVRRKRRASKKTTKKVASKKKTTKAKAEEGNNPFEATTQEQVIADVKAEAGMPEEAPFSTETLNIVESDSGETPVLQDPFNFEEVGT